jgi:hypothetical protein
VADGGASRELQADFGRLGLTRDMRAAAGWCARWCWWRCFSGTCSCGRAITPDNTSAIVAGAGAVNLGRFWVC